MTTRRVFTATAVRGSPLDLFARLTAVTTAGMTASPVASEGYLIKQADVSSISVKSYSSGVQIGTTQSPSPSAVIYDTLQTAAVWGVVGVSGGNAKYQVPASLLDTTADVVRIDISVTLTDGTVAPWLVDVTVQQASS